MNTINQRITLAKEMYTTCYDLVGGRNPKGFAFETAEEYFNNKANEAEIDKWMIAADKGGNEFVQTLQQVGKASYRQSVPEDFDLAFLRDTILNYLGISINEYVGE